MNILLGISGSIAAYKAPLIIRKFRKNNCEVKCAITQNGLRFVTLETLQNVSGNQVYSRLFPENSFDPVHIELSQWAELLLVSPASADIISKYTSGICDDLLSTLLLAFDKLKIFVPAMNTKMWDSWQIKRNIEKIRKHGDLVIEPEEGALACGTRGKGRMPSPDRLFDKVMEIYNSVKNQKP